MTNNNNNSNNDLELKAHLHRFSLSVCFSISLFTLFIHFQDLKLILLRWNCGSVHRMACWELGLFPSQCRFSGLSALRVFDLGRRQRTPRTQRGPRRHRESTGIKHATFLLLGKKESLKKEVRPPSSFCHFFSLNLPLQQSEAATGCGWSAGIQHGLVNGLRMPPCDAPPGGRTWEDAFLGRGLSCDKGSKQPMMSGHTTDDAS